VKFKMAKGLPKSIIKKYGISKRAWEVYRGLKRKVNKATTTVKSRGKSKMGRKRRARRRRGRPKRKLSIIGTTGAIGSLFVPQGRSGAMSMGQWWLEWATKKRQFRNEDVQAMLYDGVAQYTGYHPNYGWGIPWATVTLIGSGIAAKAANRFAGRYVSDIPFIGKYIKL